MKNIISKIFRTNKVSVKPETLVAPSKKVDQNSLEAYEKSKPSAATHRQKIINVFLPGQTLTAKQISDLSGIGYVEVQRRMSELVRSGNVLIAGNVIAENKLRYKIYRIK